MKVPAGAPVAPTAYTFTEMLTGRHWLFVRGTVSRWTRTNRYGERERLPSREVHVTRVPNRRSAD